MSDLHSYENIIDFADSVADTDTVLEELSILSKQEMEDFNAALTFFDDHDPVSEWGSEIRRGEPTRAFAEIVLAWHFRRILGWNAVTLNAEYTDTGKDFDLLVEWNNQKYWIDVRTPEGALGEIQESGGGWIGGRSTGKSIANKLENQFRNARDALPDNSILVLAIYLQASGLDSLLIGKYLHDLNSQEDAEDPGLFADAFLEYTHHHGKTSIDIREFTNKGEHVTKLREKLLEES